VAGLILSERPGLEMIRECHLPDQARIEISFR
jgi:hypothetical protein